MKKSLVFCAVLILLVLALAGCSTREQTPETTSVVVQFVTDGSNVHPVTNATIASAPKTVKSGFVFEGWYHEETLKTRVVFPFRADKSCKLYVKWIDPKVGNEEITFKTLDDGTLSVDKCDTSCETIWIPDAFGGKNVTELSEAFLRKKTYVTSIHIGKNVKEIKENFSRCVRLTSFDVDSENAFLRSENGVLFSKDQKTLYAYPVAKEGGEFVFPAATESVKENAFSYNLLLKTIRLNKNLSVEVSSFKGMESLESVEVESGNTSFVSKEGALYSADGTELLLFPMRYAGKSFSIASGTLYVSEDAFSGSEIETLNINKELISFSAPKSLTTLKTYSVAENNAYYRSNDGVLFTDEGTSLYLVPQGRTGEYTVPQGTKRICDFAFSGGKIEKVILPASVTEIGGYAFSECKELSSVVFQSDSEIVSIAESAFTRCTSLISVTMTSRIPPKTGASLFEYCSSAYTVIIPAYTGGLYEAIWDFAIGHFDAKGDPVVLYDVVFDAGGGTEVSAVRGAYILTEPVTSRETGNEKEYYIFLGWYDNPAGTGQKISFPYAVTGDITLYAAWDIGFYQLPEENADS